MREFETFFCLMPGVLVTLFLLNRTPVAILVHPHHPPLWVNLVTGEAIEVWLDRPPFDRPDLRAQPLDTP